MIQHSLDLMNNTVKFRYQIVSFDLSLASAEFYVEGVSFENIISRKISKKWFTYLHRICHVYA